MPMKMPRRWVPKDSEAQCAHDPAETLLRGTLLVSLDEAVEAFFLGATSVIARGKQSHLLCLSGSTMSFQLDFPLLVACFALSADYLTPLG